MSLVSLLHPKTTRFKACVHEKREKPKSWLWISCRGILLGLFYNFVIRVKQSETLGGPFFFMRKISKFVFLKSPHCFSPFHPCYFRALRFVLCLQCERSACRYWPAKAVCPGLVWGGGLGLAVQLLGSGAHGTVCGGLAGVSGSGQDRRVGIWVQDCGSRAPFCSIFHAADLVL